MFVVRVRALSACGASAASNDVLLGVGGAEMPPGAPDDFAAVVNGSAVTFSWTAPLTGGPAGAYILEAGSGPGPERHRAGAGAGHRRLTAPNVPAGTYFVRVRAVNNAGRVSRGGTAGRRAVEPACEGTALVPAGWPSPPGGSSLGVTADRPGSPRVRTAARQSASLSASRPSAA